MLIFYLNFSEAKKPLSTVFRGLAESRSRTHSSLFFPWNKHVGIV
uniref:Uncharacterized protein n=1 Tax=Arundo donax TaxID=35708 RepID=A0A0A9R2A0_ARUDO